MADVIRRVGLIESNETTKTVSIVYTAEFEERPINEQIEVLRGAAAVAQSDLAEARQEEEHSERGQ